MGFKNKSKLFANVLSDGSLIFLILPGFESKRILNAKKIDLLSHPVWTGKRSKDQTEISSFIGRLKSK
uniref:Ribosomal protein L31 n=1 Tax=Petalonia binghamiae TaxID=698476 RepID=A0A2H4ZR21_9PHAE|nr:ribosomal protein L31 [Endarachne binghamiae]AUG32989.1 ribosomal protein L31 [Endarachne binghamiae]